MPDTTTYLTDPATQTAAELSRQLAEARAECKRLQETLDKVQPLGLDDAPGPHEAPEDCPTWYDGCWCNVGNFVYNIERAETAEAQLREARAECARLRETLDIARELLKRTTHTEKEHSWTHDVHKFLAGPHSVTESVTNGLSTRERAELWRAEMEVFRAEGYAAGMAAERARCASIAMQQAKEWEAYSTFYGKGRNYSAITIAAAIRAGDKTEEIGDDTNRA